MRKSAASRRRVAARLLASGWRRLAPPRESTGVQAAGSGSGGARRGPAPKLKTVLLCLTAILTWALLLVGAFGVLGFESRPGHTGRGDDAYRDIDRFVEVLQHIRAYYVDEVDDEDLMRAAVKQMLADLDPHSQLLEGEQYGDLKVGTKGTYTGVGMEVSTRRGYPVVVSPMEGTPAQNAGLQTGDFIVAIDGRDTFGLSLGDAVGMLRGPRGTSVALTVQREGESERLEFAVVRDVVRIPSISACGVLEGGIGYTRITRFSEQAAQELADCLEGVEADSLRGLVLDLRGNPGGLLMEAVKVCELFVPEGNLLVSTRGRMESESMEYVSRSERTLDSVPLVVLVDGGSASAAEIVAGAIQDWDLGLIVGEPTFGKGSVQRVIPLGETKALKLTTSYYFTPSGRCIHKFDDSSAAEDAVVHMDNKNGEYLTSGGRKVFGGGGIKPDVVVSPTPLPPLVRRINGRGLFLSFAVDYVGKRGAPAAADAEVTPETLSAFKKYLGDEALPFEDEEFESARDAIALGIRREIARRVEGDARANLVAAEGDAQLAAAVRLLRKAGDREHLLKLALDAGGEAK
jgi:carboxyl-terminal processing protease